MRKGFEIARISELESLAGPGTLREARGAPIRLVRL